MRFLMMVKSAENQVAGPPTPAFQEAMRELVEEELKEGVLLELGGLLGTDVGAEVRVTNGEVRVIDGPFAESKEVLGGYAVFELRSKEEAIERARRLMRLHVDLWPGFEGACEIRQYVPDGPPHQG
jgi:hypothetical protein